MSEWKLILKESEVTELRLLLNICKKEFTRDKLINRKPLFNELNLLNCFHALDLEGETWSFGDYDIKLDERERADR